VKINKKTLELYTLEKEQLTAQIIPANATNKKVFWSSSNPYIAEVNEETGMVLAKSEGKADITVKTDDGNFTDKCNVTVTKKIYVTGVSLNKSSITLGVGNSEKLIATVQPSNATNQKVTWSSNSPGIASVDALGLVTAVSNGDAIITVTTDESSYTANCSVKCITVTNPVLTTSAATNISYTSATLNGNISNAGNPAYTERGFVYSSVVSVPTLNGSGCYNTTASGTGTGNYSKSVTGLDQDKTYYARAYVKTDMGVTYGNVVNFKTLKEVSNISQVRFKKVKNYTYVTEMTVDNTSGVELAGYYFGTSAGTSPYYEIPPGNHKLWYYYTEPGYEGWKDKGLYNFQKGRKYTFTCDDDGSYLTFYVTDDGPLKSSEPGIPYKPTTQVIKLEKSTLSGEKPKAIVN